MRAGSLVAVLLAGCSFNVQGTAVGDPAAGTPTTPSPTQSVPDAPDAATAPPASPTPPPPNPPPPPPDMAQRRVGTACTSNPQCDPGLICATSFGIGPGRIDIPGGYCTLECSSAACPANSFCTTFSFGKYCLSSCPPDPCRTSYQCCDESGGHKGCAPDSLCNGGKGD